MEVLQFIEKTRPPRVRCQCGQKCTDTVCHICSVSLCTECEKAVLYNYSWFAFPTFLVWDRFSYRYVGHFMRWVHRRQKLPKRLVRMMRNNEERCLIYCEACAAERFTKPNGLILAIIALSMLALAYYASDWHPFWLGSTLPFTMVAFIDQERLRRARTLPPRFFIWFFLLFGIPLIVIVVAETSMTEMWPTAVTTILFMVMLPILFLRQERWRKSPPPSDRLLPLQITSKKAKIVVEETVRGVCRLTAEGQYETEVYETHLMGQEEGDERGKGVATGKLTYSMRIADDAFKQAERHLKLYRNRLPSMFVAGVAVLQGAISFRETIVHEPEEEKGKSLYEVVSGVDGELKRCLLFERWLESVESSENGSVRGRYWRKGDLRGANLGFEQAYTYEFDQKQFPFQLIPYLVTEIEEQGKESWGVELLVRIHPNMRKNPAYKNLLQEQIKITSLKVRPSENVPPLQYAKPGNETAVDGAGREIVWGTLPFKDKDDKEGEGAKKEPTLSIYMKFREGKKSMLDNLEGFVLEGEMTAEFKGTISPLEGIELYGANCVKRLVKEKGSDLPESALEAEVGKKLIAMTTFNFAFAKLAVRQRIQSKREHVFHVPPTHILVTKLIDKLNESDFYVKIVTEKQPELDRDDSYIIRRYWLIVLRRYVDLYPIDIDLVISGREYSTVQQNLSKNPKFPNIFSHTDDQTTLTITARAIVPVYVSDIPIQDRSEMEAIVTQAADEIVIYFQQLAIMLDDDGESM